MMTKQLEGPIVRIRRVRREISAKCDHDPRKLVEHYIELQKRHADRLISGLADQAGDGNARREAGG
jgi:hypothetical protein